MKKVATTETTSEVTSENQPSIRVIKTATCKSLSGKSDLTYHIGVDADSNILIRIAINSGGGYFNQEWVALSAIQKILETYPVISSFSLRSLYVGKSTNSPGFLLAALKSESLVKLKGEKERSYVALDSDKFMAETQALMKPDAAAPAIKKKAALKAEVSPLETKSACDPTEISH